MSPNTISPPNKPSQATLKAAGIQDVSSGRIVLDKNVLGGDGKGDHGHGCYCGGPGCGPTPPPTCGPSASQALANDSFLIFEVPIIASLYS